MKRIHLVWFLFLIVFPQGTNFCTPVTTPAVLEELSDRKYLPKVIELIRNAQRSIEISIYQILLPAGDEQHPVYQILSALAEVRARGVHVRVMLNRYLDYVSGETIPLARSLAAYEYLTRKGIEVVFAHTSRRLHDKVIVIDERWVIEGSMNWTKTALESNWESVTLIDSPEYAAQKLARIRAIPWSLENSIDTLGNEGEMIEIPSVLMTEQKYFPDLLRRKDETIFEFYLWLLCVEAGPCARLAGGPAQGSGPPRGVAPTATFVFNDETLFRQFGIDLAKPQKDKRREAVRLLKKLKKRGLIDLNIAAPGSDVEIALVPIVGAVQFKVPTNYFEYGYPKRLSFAAEFAYLLARVEMSESPSPPWWWRSQEDLARVYHLHHTTLAAGMLELVRENLIEIIRDDAPEGRPHSERLVNRYRVNRLRSSAAREEQIRGLIQRFGKENFERAHRFADIIDEPNDAVVIATILKWLTLYPAKDLEAAFEQVSRYERNNPRRSLYYLHGILGALKIE